jgi:glutathione-regulated potassium-efflux system protein KefB
MGRAALKANGIEPAEIDRVDREYRMRDCERLERQTATGDLHAGAALAFSAERALRDEDGPPPVQSLAER